MIEQVLDNLKIPVLKYHPVHGGDINKTYCLQTANEKFFLKVNDNKHFPEMFKKEKDGLEALAKNFSGTVPNAICTDIVENVQYILMEWIEQEQPDDNFWKNFGTTLAQMHQVVQPHFGWHEDNYIGSLTQKNNSKDTWHDFYAEMRIMPLIEALFNQKDITSKDVKHAVVFCNEIKNIFPEETPSFLHGDLWSGNFMVASNGFACLYDPAVYNGHREMDIAMTRLFGGFNNQFYLTYNDTYPLEKGWENRLIYAQLYPLLVHALLFGGHYIQSVKSIINRF